MEDNQLRQEFEGLKQLIHELGEKIAAAMERARELESRLRDRSPEPPEDPEQEANP
jgi:phage shock protein A